MIDAIEDIFRFFKKQCNQLDTRANSKPCPDCKGLGYRDPRHPEDACSTCDGDGRVSA